MSDEILVAEDVCEVCGEPGEILLCHCGAELCGVCMTGHAHVEMTDK